MQLIFKLFSSSLLVGFCLLFSQLSAQIDPPSLDAEDQDLEVGVLTSQTTSTRLSLNTSNYLLNGSEKRGFIETDDQILRLGLSNNNDLGSVRLSYNNGSGVIDGLTLSPQGYIGIGTTSPNAKFHILESTFGYVANMESTASDSWMGFTTNNGYIGYAGVYTNNSDMDFGTGGGNSVGKVNIVCEAIPRMTIETDGTVTINNQYELPTTDGSAGEVLTTDGSGVVSWGSGASGPEAFHANLAAALPLPNFTFVGMDNFSQIIDTNGNFDEALGTYTAPQSGIYEFTFSANVANNPTIYTDRPFTIRWNRNGTTYKQHTDKFSIDSGYQHTLQYSIMIELDPGDVLSLEVRQVSGATQSLLGGNSINQTTFSGHLIR